jgi:N-succinyldiaminopimelate aminotransferase
LAAEALAGRLRGFGVSVFDEMTALAERTGAVNLGQGVPDGDGPPELLAAAGAAIAGGLNQYPPSEGLPGLRAAVAAQRLARYGTEYDPASEVLVTFGATEAMSAALLALCEPGDEVLVLEPFYDSYPVGVALAGATLRPVPLAPAGDRFALDPAALAAAAGPRSRVLLVNSPHNPTGTVLTRAELAAIAEVCQERDLIAITDEVYEYLTYDGAEHVSLASLPGMRERTLAVSSAAKTFNVTGWKVGWVCGPARLVSAVLTVKQHLSFGGGTPFQAAVASILPGADHWIAGQLGGLRDRRDLLSAGLVAAGLRPYRCDGTFYLLADTAALGPDGERFCRELPARAGVVAIPAAAFYGDSHAGRTLVRFAFCKRADQLERAVRGLAQLR